MANPNGRNQTQQEMDFYRMVEVFRWYDGLLYDTFRFTGTSISPTTRNMFAIVKGQSGDGFGPSPIVKTYAETNHGESGKMSGDRAGRVRYIAVDVTSVPGSIVTIQNQHRDMLTLMRFVTLAYQSGDNVRQYGRIGWYPAGSGPSGFAAVDTDDTGSPPVSREVEAITNGVPVFGAQVPLQWEEILLAPAQSFAFTFQNETTLTLLNDSTYPYDMCIKLWGLWGVRQNG